MVHGLTLNSGHLLYNGPHFIVVLNCRGRYVIEGLGFMSLGSTGSAGFNPWPGSSGYQPGTLTLADLCG